MAIKERGSVGRRIWRRRKKRGTPPVFGAAAATDEEGQDGDGLDPQFDGSNVFPRDRSLPNPPSSDKPSSLWARMKSILGKKPTPPTYLLVDPLREILAIPRGAARLDAFEKTLTTLETGTADHRRVALAFHDELVALTQGAGLDLALFEGRVHACADALVDADEPERAGQLFASLGRRHRAAELFVRAGAIDELEETYAHLSFDEGGARAEARRSFGRFESLFLVGMRNEALVALEHAVALWRDNPVYEEVLHGFHARLVDDNRGLLQAGAVTVRLVGAWPVLIGRGEDCAVRIDSPLVSRAHLRLSRDVDGAISAMELESHGGTRLDHAVLHGRGVLQAEGLLDISGIVIRTERRPGGLLLTPKQTPNHPTLAVIGDVVEDALLPGLRLRFLAGRLCVEPAEGLRLNQELLRRPTLLLDGDRIAVGGRTFVVGR